MKDVLININDCSSIITNEFKSDLVSVDELLDFLENLLIEVEHLEERLRNLENNWE